MALLKFRSTRPPRGFYYIQPETKLRIEGEDYGALTKLVLAHRQYKGLARATMAEVEEDVERQICSRLTTMECKPEYKGEKLRPADESAVISIGTVMQFTKAAFEWLGSGAKVVDVDLLKRRQDTCLSCPLNNPVSGCSCSLFYKTINTLIPESRRNQDLHVCSACGCSTNAKTQMPIEMVLRADEGRNITYPVGCWVPAEQACQTTESGQQGKS